MYSYLTSFIDRLSNPPEDISELIKTEKYVMKYKGYGTPELEMKYLHRIFLHIQKHHPEFKSFSWEQCNAYNDNYYHFQLNSFTVNDTLNVESDIDFYFQYEEDEKITSGISIRSTEYPDPDEIEFENENKANYENEGEDQKDSDFWGFIHKKYKPLETPCLKFLTVLKLLEVNFGMYFLLYTFGNGVRIRFDQEGVAVIKLEENEMEGVPLGKGMNFDEA